MLMKKSVLPDSLDEIEKGRTLPFLEEQVVMAARHKFNMIIGQKIFERLLGYSWRDNLVLCLQENVDVISVQISKVF